VTLSRSARKRHKAERREAPKVRAPDTGRLGVAVWWLSMGSRRKVPRYRNPPEQSFKPNQVRKPRDQIHPVLEFR
jgi:hypothetical protein